MSLPSQYSSATPSAKKVPGGTALAVMLAALAMLGPFSVDTYLPAFPAIQASLQASQIEVQQTLTAYMLSFAIMILWHGALSDAFGRRSIVLGSLALFAFASLGCALSHKIGYLWAFRILQGVSAGAGVVIGRAMIRDLHADATAARLLSLVTMIFSIAPAMAPVLGGWVVKLLDWRWIFFLLTGYTALLLWYCWKNLPETLPPQNRRPFHPSSLMRSYREVLFSPLFQFKAGAASFNFAGLFLYVAAAPVFLTEHLHLGPDQFAWQFIPAVGGIFTGALAANRMAGRMPVTKQIGIGYAFLMSAAGVNLLYHAFFPPALPWSVAPLFFYCFGMSIAAPVLTLLILDLFPRIRGVAASCQSFTQTMLAALIAGVVAPVLSVSVLWLAVGQFAMVAVSLMLWLGSRAYHRSGRIDKPARD